MHLTISKSRALVVAAVASLSLVTAACGSDDKPMPTDETTAAPTDAETVTGLVGPGCADYVAQVPEGDGSLEQMAQDPVATAASNNPLLKTLTAAVSGKLNPRVTLVDTLNSGEYTVFAPVDEAFAKLPKETVKTLGTDEGAETLIEVLTYHVVTGQLPPDKVAGDHETLNGAKLVVEGSGDEITVGKDKAKLVCGGIKTANATVYLIDSVLMPPS
jgi:uncharacterized surface protein with fasciclin (FAS1) repeats